MTHIKIFVFALLTSASLNIKAQTMSGSLNLSNAGRYFIGLALNHKAVTTLEVKQSLITPLSSASPENTPEVCLTEFRLNAGTYSFILTEADKNVALTLTGNLNLSASHYDPTDKCSDVNLILSQPLEFYPYFYLGELALPDKKTMTSITIFPYGDFVTLNVSKEDDNQFSIQNLNTQLASQIKRKNKQALSYRTYMKDNKDSVLRNGYVELR